MSKFKVGDEVKIVKTGKFDILSKGEIVTIISVKDDQSVPHPLVVEDRYGTQDVLRINQVEPLNSTIENKDDIPDIKSGYILDLGEEGLASVGYTYENKLGVCNEKAGWDLDRFDDNLEFKTADLVIRVEAIYGRTYSSYMNNLSTDFRSLLWEREEILPIKTQKELEEELGYKFKLAKE